MTVELSYPKEGSMKFLLFILLITGNVFASENTIDDLDHINLNLDQSATVPHDIHYPNYRMGGGNGAGRRINDCLLLDIRHSDAVLTLEQKVKVAKALIVKHGFGDPQEEMKATIQGKHVVFLMPGYGSYMTYLKAESRDGRSLNEVIGKALPSVRPGNTVVPPASLLYVRDCRF